MLWKPAEGGDEGGAGEEGAFRFLWAIFARTTARTPPADGWDATAGRQGPPSRKSGLPSSQRLFQLQSRAIAWGRDALLRVLRERSRGSAPLPVASHLPRALFACTTEPLPSAVGWSWNTIAFMEGTWGKTSGKVRIFPVFKG